VCANVHCSVFARNTAGHILNTGTSAGERRRDEAIVKALAHHYRRRGWDVNIPASEWAVILVIGNGYRRRTTLPASHGLINFALSTIAFVAVAFLDLSD
jgi:hypothetical protein